MSPAMQIANAVAKIASVAWPLVWVLKRAFRWVHYGGMGPWHSTVR
jgi:hypothetical protein